jgi:hypothetical protein
MTDGAPSGLHCSLSGRAWTDLFTNQTQLAGFDNEKHLDGLTERGMLPVPCLSPFLHESVHHWCFDSRVGAALAYLHHRAMRSAVYAHNRSAVTEDYLRTTTATRMMRPLAEGLALLAEFDVIPSRSSPLWSNPLWWTYLLFCRPSVEEVNDPARYGNSLYYLLADYRSSADCVRHKSNLLLHPLDSSEGGYLSGYLVVRRMWYEASIRSRKFLDTDFFMLYVQTFFYDDWGLINALLQPRVHGKAAIVLIYIYIQKRFNDFMMLDHEAEAARFSEYLQAHGNDESYSPAILSAEDREVGQELWKKVIADITVSDPQTDEDRLRRIEHLMLAQRELLCLTHVPIRVEADGPDSYTGYYKDLRFITGKYTPTTRGTVGPGSVGFYVSIKHKFRVETVAVGPVQLSATITGGSDGVTAEQTKNYFLDFAGYTDWQRHVNEFVERMAQQADEGGLLAGVEREMSCVSSQFYPRFALLDAFESLYPRMTKRGFFDILDSDPEIVRAFALLSLRSSLGDGVRELRTVFTKENADLDSTISRLARLKEAGLQLGYLRGDWLITAF